MTKRAALPVLVALAISQWLCSGCRRNQNITSQPQGNSSYSRRAPAPRGNEEDSQQSKHAMIEQRRKEALEMMRTGRGRKREKRLPNPICGPGRPLPDYVNFYEVHENYPAYLLCTFSVNKQHYDPNNESAWFKSALLQMRSSGPRSFWPTLKWVAVIITNSAEHKGVTTFEQSHKVGAIFDLKEVFDSSRDPAALVAQTQTDRHPFVFDVRQPDSWKQDRWMIVERHAAAAGK